MTQILCDERGEPAPVSYCRCRACRVEREHLLDPRLPALVRRFGLDMKFSVSEALIRQHLDGYLEGCIALDDLLIGIIESLVKHADKAVDDMLAMDRLMPKAPSITLRCGSSEP